MNYLRGEKTGLWMSCRELAPYDKSALRSGKGLIGTSRENHPCPLKGGWATKRIEIGRVR